MQIRSIVDFCDSVVPYTTNVRRHLHMYPELSGREYETARYVYTQLKSMGLKPSYCIGKTGVSAVLSSGNGPTVVLRADIDALPVAEQNTVFFKSKHDGVMHACGHDIHTATLIGAAKVLSDMKDQWSGKVVLLFQPSEEVEPGGADAMIREGLFPGDTKAVFGMHVSSEHPAGVIGIKEGACCSSVLTFDVRVIGKGGHGAKPEESIDPIVCASTMIMELQTLISRECSPLDPAVLTVGTISAGTKRNIIPDEAVFSGTIRTFETPVEKQLKMRVRDVLKGVARTHGASAEITFEKSYPAVHNDRALCKQAFDTMRKMSGKKMVLMRNKPTMGADDFAYFSQKKPGLYAFLGVRPSGKKSAPDIHSARFNPDELSLTYGVRYFAAMALDTLDVK